MDSRIDAIMGGSRLTKRTVSALKVSLNFAAMSLKAGEGKEYKDKGYSGKNIERPTSSGFCRTSGWA